MTPHAPLDLVSIGGFGHSVLVFDEIAPSLGRLKGMAPAFAGESLESFAGHPLAARDAPEIFPSADALYRALQPRVAIVSTEPGRIAGEILRALEAGCDVIAEKPLALADADLSRIHATLRETGRLLLPMLNMRSFPAFAAARQAYASGRIGDVVAANARKSYKWGAQRPEWFADRARYGGTFPWIGIHALDMIHFITGQGFVEVSAFHANLGHPERAGCEDVGAAAFRMENGALASVSLDYFRPAGADTHGDDWCRIVGTRGILEANASAGWCRVLADGDSTPRELPLAPQRPIFAEFLEQLAAGAATGDAATGLHLSDACLAARIAADTGERQRIQPARWL